VAAFLVTVKDDSGNLATSEIEAENYFTDGEWVTFWSPDRLHLPEPLVRFEKAAIVRIEVA
jgi:hypothetical protein